MAHPMKVRTMASGRRSRAGATLVLACLLMIVIAAFIAFCVDVGRMYLVRSQMQKAVDAGALAAALQMRQNDSSVAAAVAAAEDFVQRNRVGFLATIPTDAITIEPGIWNSSTKTFTATTVDPEVVRVAARQDGEPTFFAGIFGKQTFGVPRDAIASIDGGKMDIMLTLDLSGSMRSQGRIEALQDAAPVFVDVIEATGGNDQIGMMGYGAVKGKYDPVARGHHGVPYLDAPAGVTHPDGWIGVLESGLTSSFSYLRNSVLDPGTLTANKYNGWTPTGAAIRDTTHYLTLNARPDAKRFIVLMSDGHANKPDGNGPGYALDMADYAKVNDITVYTISLGNSADEQLMEDIATRTGGQHFVASGSGQTTLSVRLTEAFRKVAGSIKGTQLVK